MTEAILAPRVVTTLERAAWLGAIVVTAVGVFALGAWAVDAEALGAMKANAAIAFVLAGVALALRRRPDKRKRTARALSTGVSVIGALTLLEYAGADLGIDELVFADEETVLAPGRMSPTTAATFLALGLSLVFLDARSRGGHALAEVLAFGAGLVSLLALLGNLYGVRALYALGDYEEVALHPAATMAVCAGSILCTRADRGAMRVVASEGPGGSLARRLLPAAILIPAVIGGLLIAGEQLGLFDVAHETALFAAASIVCFTALTWWTASAIVRVDHARRAAERQATRMETVGRLAGGIAHDFNNLLTVIITYGYILQRRATADEGIAEMVRAANRAAELTRQLLALSRQQVLHPTVVDLGTVLDSMTDMLRRSIGEDIELSIDIARPLATIYVDAGQLEQVILNLVVNARDAMPRGGRITLAAANIGTRVRLTVRDTGTGMDTATLAQIFEPYFTTKPATKGTGLGLPTALGIVEQSGGEIQVSSTVGSGTTFEVYLPRHAGPVEEPRAVANPAVATGTETILLVEDDAQVRALITTALRAHGYTVIDAATPGDALLAAEQHAVDLLLTDVVMPRMSGRQLAERVAQLRPGIRVLFMSGHTDDAILEHGVESTSVSFIAKPLTPDALLAKLRQVLDGR